MRLSDYVSKHRDAYDQYNNIIKSGTTAYLVRKFYPELIKIIDEIADRYAFLCNAHNSLPDAFQDAMLSKTIALSRKAHRRGLSVYEAYNQVFNNLATWRRDYLDGDNVPLVGLLQEYDDKRYYAVRSGFGVWFAAFVSEFAEEGQGISEMRKLILDMSMSERTDDREITGAYSLVSIAG